MILGINRTYRDRIRDVNINRESDEILLPVSPLLLVLSLWLHNAPTKIHVYTCTSRGDAARLTGDDDGTAAVARRRLRRPRDAGTYEARRQSV